MSFRRWLFPSGYRAANHYNRGTLACHSGDWISAEAHLREAVQAWQDYPDAWHNLGIALAAQSRFDDAIEAYETALWQRRYFAEAWNNYGAALAKTGRVDDARKAFTESLRLKPSYQKARENLDSLNEIVKRQSRVFGNQQPAPPDAVRRLIDAVFLATHQAAGCIGERWMETVGETSVPTMSLFVLRSEILWFFLHAVRRQASSVGGTESKELTTLVEALSIRSMVTVFWHGQQAREGFDPDEANERMIRESLDAFAEIEAEYAGLPLLASGGAPSDSNAVSLMCSSILETLGLQANVGLHSLMLDCATEQLASFPFPELVSEAWKQFAGNR